MFAEFSRGYYLGRLYVEPGDDDAAKMCRTQHERVNRRLYADSGGIERLDHPLVMKLGTNHFTVHGDEDVPADTLTVPEKWVEATVRNPPALREVLLAKADRASQLLAMAPGWSEDPMT